MKRKASVQGQFYPAQQSELCEIISHWYRSEILNGCCGAIVPHAGYIYSGESAWKALTAIDWQQFDRVVIIGPSHRVPFLGISIFTGTTYETVGGDHPYDCQFAENIKDKLGLITIESAHHEHCTEVQIPLIHQLAPQIPVIECVYGQNVEHSLVELIRELRNSNRTAIVISSDLSHYHSESTAHEIDKHTVDGIINLDLSEISEGESCGKAGIAAAVDVCVSRKDRMQLIDYRTSADSPFGDKGRVVGYCSAGIIEYNELSLTT